MNYVIWCVVTYALRLLMYLRILHVYYNADNFR